MSHNLVEKHRARLEQLRDNAFTRGDYATYQHFCNQLSGFDLCRRLYHK